MTFSVRMLAGTHKVRVACLLECIGGCSAQEFARHDFVGCLCDVEPIIEGSMEHFPMGRVLMFCCVDGDGDFIAEESFYASSQDEDEEDDKEEETDDGGEQP